MNAYVGMYMYIAMYMYVCICIYDMCINDKRVACVCMHVYISVSSNICTYINVCMYACMNIYEVYQRIFTANMSNCL